MMSKKFTFPPDLQTISLLLMKNKKVYLPAPLNGKIKKQRTIYSSLEKSILKNADIFKIWDLGNNALPLYFKIFENNENNILFILNKFDCCQVLLKTEN